MEDSFHARILAISSVLLGIAFLVLSNGLQGTLLGVRAGLEGMAEENIGLFISAYFFGYALGSIVVLKLIRRAGHIRVFAALASIISLTHIMFISPWVWVFLRVVYGLCFAGFQRTHPGLWGRGVLRSIPGQSVHGADRAGGLVLGDFRHCDAVPDV